MSRIDSTTPVRMSTNMSVQRQTPNTDFGARVKNGLDTAASAAANGAAVAAPFVPGGAILSAAVSSVSTMTNGGGSAGGAVGTAAYASGVGSVGGPINTTVGGSTGGSTAIGGGSAGGMNVAQTSGSVSQAANGAGIDLDVQYQRQMGLLALQNQMQQENQTFSTLSNVMKTKHDTAKNSIANVR